MRTARFLLVAVAFVFVSLITARAEAFCRTRTVDPQTCGHVDSNGCTTCGNPIWWKTACVGFDVQKGASRAIPYDDALGAVQRAFSAWTEVTCPGAPAPNADAVASKGKVSIAAVDLGPVSCDIAQYNEDGGPNQNLVVFHDDAWPHKSERELSAHLASPDIALTTVTYDTTTGEIWDADIELNTAEHTIVISATPAPGTFDLQSILTHEAGHFFGLAHSPLSDAVMFYEDEGGSSKRRNLSSDDEQAICSIYRPDGERGVGASVGSGGLVKGGGCDATPRHGFTSQCSSPSSHACALSPHAPSRGGSDAAGSIAIFAVVTLIVRRRRRAPPRGGALPSRASRAKVCPCV